MYRKKGFIKKMQKSETEFEMKRGENQKGDNDRV